MAKSIVTKENIIKHYQLFKKIAQKHFDKNNVNNSVKYIE